MTKSKKSIGIIMATFLIISAFVFIGVTQNAEAKISNAVNIKSATFYVKPHKLVIKYDITRKLKSNEKTEYSISCPVTICGDKLKRTKGSHTYTSTNKLNRSFANRTYRWCDGYTIHGKSMSNWDTEKVKLVW